MPQASTIPQSATLFAWTDRNGVSACATELAARDIEWTKKYGAYGYAFNLKSIVQAGGPGEFTVKFYSGPEPVFTRDFRIVR